MTVKSITLCADDFAQNAAISRGILNLLRAKRLSATSCMAQSACWPEFAQELKAFQGAADIGLHFNLTHNFNGNPVYPLPKLMLNRFSGAITSDNAYRALNHQLDLFENHFGTAPDFIDGHQHVHQFAGVREALIKTITTRYRSQPPYIRRTLRANTAKFSVEPIKSAIIAIFGGRTLAAQLSRHNIASNTDFGGIYDLRPASPFAKHMQEWLAKTLSGGLIMCHPGLGSEDSADPIRAARVKEYNYLLSREFEIELAQQQVHLSRLIR